LSSKRCQSNDIQFDSQRAAGKQWTSSPNICLLLLITDWMMPDFSGIELCEKYPPTFSGILHIHHYFDWHDEKSEVVKGLTAGADDYLTKPFDRAEIASSRGKWAGES